MSAADSPLPSTRRLRLFAPIVVVVVALVGLLWGAVIYKVGVEEALVVHSINTLSLIQT